MSNLQRAIEIAVDAHKNQVDKAGAPYILHPLRVMLALQTNTERIVAVLHDVVEDSESWTFNRLASEGFSEEIIAALRSVTKNDPLKNPIRSDSHGQSEHESYMDFIKRAGANEIGAKVKRADLKDNMDLSRIADPTEQDFSRMKRYKEALALLNGR
jgi:(p)ppGpp synthase/HD superfamily hydrolase